MHNECMAMIYYAKGFIEVWMFINRILGDNKSTKLICYYVFTVLC